MPWCAVLRSVQDPMDSFRGSSTGTPPWPTEESRVGSEADGDGDINDEGEWEGIKEDVGSEQGERHGGEGDGAAEPFPERTEARGARMYVGARLGKRAAFDDDTGDAPPSSAITSSAIATSHTKRQKVWMEGTGPVAGTSSSSASQRADPARGVGEGQSRGGKGKERAWW